VGAPAVEDKAGGAAESVLKGGRRTSDFRNLLYGVIPTARAFTSGPRDLPNYAALGAGDPSLRLKDGSARDDPVENGVQNFKLSHYLKFEM
jgi:hypothetical protein